MNDYCQVFSNSAQNEDSDFYYDYFIYIINHYFYYLEDTLSISKEVNVFKNKIDLYKGTKNYRIKVEKKEDLNYSSLIYLNNVYINFISINFYCLVLFVSIF